MPSTSKRRRTVQEDEEESEEDIRPTQSARKGKRRAPASDDEDENPAEDDEGEGMDIDGAESEPQDQVVKKLVRYALACEYQRVRITRTGISEKVIGKQRGAAFKRIFENAQQDLRTKFGMEMVVLPANEKVTVKQKRAAAKTSGNARPATTTNYILTSILDSDYKSASIMPPSMIGASKDEAQYMAICTVVVSILSLSQGGLTDSKLTSYLRRLNLESHTPVGPLKDTLARMKRDGYINRVTEQTVEDESITWHVGPRGKVEIGKMSVRGFVHEVYGKRAPKDLDKRVQRSLGMDIKKSTSRNEDAAAAAASQNRNPGPSTQTGRGKAKKRRAATPSDEDD